ncbi:MAG: gluconokinase [Blastocatellales bacterium]
MATVSPVEATRPLVFALDVGTSSVRAVLYDTEGRMVENIEGRTHYQMTATQDGGVEIEADRLLEIIGQTIDECLAEAKAVLPDLNEAIACVGYSNFWHAMLGVDAAGQAVTPLYNWSDTRSAADAKSLDEELGSKWIHSRTGVVPHASYYPAKILWLRRTHPQLAAKVTRFVSIGEYFYSKVFGRFACGVGMATGTGLFNPNKNDWDDEMLSAIGLTRDQLSPLTAEREAMTGMKAEFADRWPALKNAEWMTAVGDGACSNIGSGCFNHSLIAINVGTSGAMRVCWPVERVKIPDGLWFYRANRHYGLIGGALSNAGDVYAWCKRTLKLSQYPDREGVGDLKLGQYPDREGVGNSGDELELQLAQMEADGHGLTVLPFFSGERSTGWHDAARASIIGMNLSTDPIEILRAAMEAVCYRFAAIHERLQAELSGETRIIASGGGILASKVWTQMMADVIGVPVVASAVPEASSRGAAMLALEAFGYIKEFGELPTPLGEEFAPNAENHQRYKEGRARQEKFYELLIANPTNVF